MKVNDILLVLVKSLNKEFLFTLLVNSIEYRLGYIYISYVPINYGISGTNYPEEICLWGTMKLPEVPGEYGVQEWMVVGHQYNSVKVDRTSMVEAVI